MPHRQDRLIHSLLDSLELETTLFHLGQYCGSWRASTTGLARAGFHLILDGDCWLHFPDNGERHSLQAGDAVFFLRDLPHLLSPHADPEQALAAPRCEMQPLGTAVDESISPTGLACGFFEFRGALANTWLASFPAYVVIRRESEGREEGGGLAATRPIFDLILAEARAVGEAGSPLLTRLIGLLLFYAIRHLSRTREVATGLWGLLSRPDFRPLLEALLDAPGQDWSTERMADLSCMSRATFFKRFTEVAGTSPSHFLAQLRMHKATQLIASGVSLSRAAEEVGYQSDAAFSRAFKKVTGSLPGAWRRHRVHRGESKNETNEQQKATFAH